VDELRTLGEGIERSSNRVALALVTLGLYIAASLLMQHSLGPQLWEVPVLALIGYLLALVFTLRLVRAASRRL
jgi:ubiquinone biosynthesis protein